MGWRKSSTRYASAAVVLAVLAGAINRSGRTQEKVTDPAPKASSRQAELHQFVTQYCADCHNATENAGGLDLDAVSKEEAGKHPKSWEAVVRKLAARQMPPLDAGCPSESQYASIVAELETHSIARRPQQPNPGRTDTFRRLNRTEYQNAIRDLLALDIDATALAAERRVEPRVRQRDGGRPLADAAGPLHHRGAEDQPAGRRQPAAIARRRHDPHPAGPHPGGARRGAADRHARRGA